MDITLDTEIIVREERKTSTVTTHQTIDDATAKTVSVILIMGQKENGENIYRTITLWEGQAYDDAGQWTDTDLANRIKELLTPTV